MLPSILTKRLVRANLVSSHESVALQDILRLSRKGNHRLEVTHLEGTQNPQVQALVDRHRK